MRSQLNEVYNSKKAAGGVEMAYKVLIVEDQEIPRELFKIYIDSSEKF